MGILSWIIFGLIAGILAKWIMPGKDGGGFIVTVILGIIGAVVGGWISTLFGFGKVDGFNFGSFFIAVPRSGDPRKGYCPSASPVTGTTST
ncbi:GlsB/YeaQ/YmgE family stress response membrane protein [Klebsiella variicola]|uniref:GlsB/YeaQ/YmgE family stress response membrane protein n=1 Tax=Klebsiella variicola TaxID=244366 RepID=UPI001D18A170|nr:GlsB/YeaQ/YmgE family stress response membrane protein [Klebsiella variicola]